MTPKEEKRIYQKKKLLYLLIIILIEFVLYTFFYIIFSLFNSMIELPPVVRFICLVLFFPITYYLTSVLAKGQFVDRIINENK